MRILLQSVYMLGHIHAGTRKHISCTYLPRYHDPQGIHISTEKPDRVTSDIVVV